jgi:hypothetical protein
MPARDGSGPKGQGSGTGRGMGNCVSNKTNIPQATVPGVRNKPFGWGGGVWDGAFSRLFRRRRANRINRK